MSFRCLAAFAIDTSIPPDSLLTKLNISSVFNFGKELSLELLCFKSAFFVRLLGCSNRKLDTFQSWSGSQAFESDWVFPAEGSLNSWLCASRGLGGFKRVVKWFLKISASVNTSFFNFFSSGCMAFPFSEYPCSNNHRRWRIMFRLQRRSRIGSQFQ